MSQFMPDTYRGHEVRHVWSDDEATFKRQLVDPNIQPLWLRDMIDGSRVPPLFTPTAAYSRIAFHDKGPPAQTQETVVPSHNATVVAHVHSGPTAQDHERQEPRTRARPHKDHTRGRMSGADHKSQREDPQLVRVNQTNDSEHWFDEFVCDDDDDSDDYDDYDDDDYYSCYCSSYYSDDAYDDYGYY